MKITALYDENGVILAASVLNEQSDGVPAAVPVASHNARVGTFDVPASVAEQSLEEVCTLFRVDAASQGLVGGKPR